MSNGGVLGRRNVPGVDGVSGVWSLREIANARRAGVWSSDPHWANVAALLHMDGANGSTTFTDEKGNVWTPETGVEISTTQSKFGGASGRFEVAAKQNRIITPSSPSFHFGTGQFTVEGWFYITGIPVSTLVFFAKDSNAAGREYSFRFTTSGGVVTGVNILLFNSAGSVGANITHSTTISQNTWHHVAISRDASNDVRSFLNGTVLGTTNSATGSAERAAQVSVGSDTFNSDPSRYQGFIDDLRITKGAARYTAAFTPPTAPFPD